MFAIAVSTVVSLTVTPMICAHFVRKPPSRDGTRLDRIVEAEMGRLTRGYMNSLTAVLHHRLLMGIVMLATLAVTVNLYIKTPKGYFPQDDTWVLCSPPLRRRPISPTTLMVKLQRQALDIVLADPAVSGVGSSVGASGLQCLRQPGTHVHQPQAHHRARRRHHPARRRPTAPRAVARGGHQRIHDGLAGHPRRRAPGAGAIPAHLLEFGSLDTLYAWVPKIVDSLRQVPGLVDVNTDREQGGLQANIIIDRQTASRLGVRIQDIDSALNNAFAQRQISTIYTQRNQYRIVLEVDPRYQRDPTDLSLVFVPGKDGAQVPLGGLVRLEKTLAPLVVNHQGPFPAVTISYNLRPDATLDEATQAIQQAVAEARGCRIHPR